MIEQDYHNRRVLLTGASSGIGFCQMKTYLAAGAQVVAIDRQPISYDHPQLTKINLDLGQQDQVEQLGQEFSQAELAFDIFLSTAGILDGFRPLLEQSLAEIDQVLAVNLRAAVVLTQAILPKMLANGGGQFVYMASIAGQQAGGGGAAYTMAKHGLIGFTRQLAYDYAQEGIRVNAIAPGAIKTAMNAADFAGDGLMAKTVAEQTPAKRWADPQEVADLTLYLTSPQASYMNGAVLTMDGGWSLGH